MIAENLPEEDALQKKPAAFALSFAVTFVLGAPAWSQSGYQTINGTRVFTQIDQAAGVATFSNDCGTQRLTQAQLQNGAIPNQIVPCPRPNGASGSPAASDVLLKDARERFAKAMNLFNQGANAKAQTDFEGAERIFRLAGDAPNAEIAGRNKRLSICRWMSTHDLVSEKSLRQYLGQGRPDPDSMDEKLYHVHGICLEFPAEAAAARAKLASLEQQAQQQKQSAPVTPPARAAQQPTHSVERPAPSRLPEPALPPVRVAQQPPSAEKPAPPRLPEPALPPPARSVQQPTPSVEKAARSRLPEPALPPLAASKQLASRETMNQPPLPQGQAVGPIVDANSLRAQQGTCSDITGVGGGPGPSNCQQNNGIPSNVQAQINQARASSQKLNPSQQDLQSAAQRYRQVEATLRAAGDLANAAIAADQALKLEDALATPAAATQDSCPPIGPEAYWRGTANEEYCGHAKCLERGSAYYGMVCFPPDRQKAASRNEEKKCLEKLGSLRGRNLAEGEIEILMGNAGCKPDGTPMSLRDRLKWVLRHKDFAVGEPDPFVTIDPKYKFCTTDYAAPPGSGISICWLEAGNGYCKKWREKPDGSKLPFDYVKADKQGFSDDVVNASIYTQHCPEGADRKWIDFWAQSKN